MLDKIVMVPVIWHSECDSSGITDFGNSKTIAISTFEIRIIHLLCTKIRLCIQDMPAN
jgi:hypothetical protein